MKHSAVVSAAGVEPRPITWLIDGMIPHNRVTILDGDPGQGKSFLTLELAAALSIGETLTPRGRKAGAQAMRSLILNAEDDVESTIVPRLIGLRADLRMIDFCPGKPTDGKSFDPLLLPRDSTFLDELVAAQGSRLLVIDPIMAFLDPEVKTASDQSVRLALRCVQEIAATRRCAIILVRHLNKGGSKKAIYRGGGSIGIVGLARAAFYVGPNPEDDREKLFAQVKNNLGPLATPWRFTLSAGPQNARQIRWHGSTGVPLSRLLDAQDAPLPIETAEEFLKNILAQGKAVEVRKLMQDAKAEGIHPGTLIRAKEKLKVQSKKVAKVWYWLLPGGKVERDPIDELRDSLFT